MNKKFFKNFKKLIRKAFPFLVLKDNPLQSLGLPVSTGKVFISRSKGGKPPATMATPEKNTYAKATAFFSSVSVIISSSEQRNFLSFD